ncbi:hypothetical protein BDZ89DRAFT_1144717 [Hymenopellis radicata]|nr:hypothetical protein BDZ89DRAFT_1144717 [Hymenopellis radicata]
MFMQSCICDEFLKRFAERTKNIKVGDPFAEPIDQGPQEDRVTVHLSSTEGYFVSPPVYSLIAAVFSQNINRALETAHKLKASTAWVNCARQLYFWPE